ncbi:aminoglycoside phosphotransferase family protein [Amycolatopsis sp. NBC_00348]|uniref:aminoglycoside phosphotransferase family protein n=1 Tax=unclassified Amycolatopsis TaxID=2618356 RepID=UPI002E27509E|nr:MULTISPECIES: aminoglycoside phosphotransferase family protein [unclassified Amycolatopsis]
MSQAKSLTEESAPEVAIVACQKVGIDSTNANLIRLGSNAVFRLDGRIILRISREQSGFGDANRQVGVARWLADVDYPANRALDVSQPVDASGYPATFWESVSEEEQYASIGQVAELIRSLHDLPTPEGLSLPTKDPFGELESHMGALENLEFHDANFLRNRIDELKDTYADLEFELPAGVIHGDANVGNVILARDGSPCLIDLDSFGIGHREWDLVQTALFYERFGWHTTEEYRTFVDIYGFDIMKWQGYETLASYREISMTLWLAAKESTKAATEVEKRVEAIRTGGDRRNWAPF